jgi:hypothetical protein
MGYRTNLKGALSSRECLNIVDTQQAMLRGSLESGIELHPLCECCMCAEPVTRNTIRKRRSGIIKSSVGISSGKQYIPNAGRS